MTSQEKYHKAIFIDRECMM